MGTTAPELIEAHRRGTRQTPPTAVAAASTLRNEDWSW